MTLSVDGYGPVFRAGALPVPAAARAFPLVHLANPSIDLAEWTALVKALSGESAHPAGMRAFEDERGYIHGVFSWALEPPQTPQTLRIANVVLAHWPGRALHDAVIGDIRRLARDAQAPTVMVEAHDNRAGLRLDLLKAGGFSPAGDNVYVAQVYAN